MAWSINRAFSFGIQPIYSFSRVFGLIPFSIVHEINGDVITSKVRTIDGILFAASIILQVILAVYHYMRLYVESQGVPYVLILASKILPSLANFYTIMIIVMNMNNRHKIINIIRMFNTVDKEVTNSMHVLNIYTNIFFN